MTPAPEEQAVPTKLRPLPNPISKCQPELRHPTKWSVHIDFVPRDLWIGVFVGTYDAHSYYLTNREPYYSGGSIRVGKQKTYVCLVPCFPVVVTRTHETEVPYYSK